MSKALTAALVPRPCANLAPPASPAPLIRLRGYQANVFWDHATKTQILHWSRQIGKSFTLANWAVKRLLDHPGRTVTVLSNSRANGEEFVLKCHEVCLALSEATRIEKLELQSNNPALDKTGGALSEDEKYKLMHAEVRIRVQGRDGRILVLAANPRTARGFSGDLILDEFAFHEDSRAIWDAASPIISSNKDYLCRIASTGNGKRNMFYQLIAAGRVSYCRVRRSDAWASGELKIYSEIDGREITPDEAESEASDKAAYRQNYECEFGDENSILLTHELISQAEDPHSKATIETGTFSPPTLDRLSALCEPLYAGVDVARTRDLSVITVLSASSGTLSVETILRLRDTRLPAQCAELAALCRLPNLRRIEVDMTGLGLGLVEFAQEMPHGRKVHGVNFSATAPVSTRLLAEGRKAPTARITEIMATDLLGALEDRRLRIPADAILRDDLRKPEKLTSPGGRVSIAATRDDAGHADHFWSLALAVRAASAQATAPLPRDTGDLGTHRAYDAYANRQNRRLLA